MCYAVISSHEKLNTDIPVNTFSHFTVPRVHDVTELGTARRCSGGGGVDRGSMSGI